MTTPLIQSGISRRSFFKRSTTAAALAGLSGLGALPAIAGPSPLPRPSKSGPKFPKDFWWGVATAAYQIEGAALEDGRKPSIWDTFSKRPGTTKDGKNGDVACDHYHRYLDDVKLMADLGVKHYRFSISWPRLMPDGTGAVNSKGVDFYRRLAEALLANGITPHATLYHWDLPQALQDRYAGWQSRDIAKDYADYAHVAVKSLGDVVNHWMTMNEISCFALNIGYGVNRPGAGAPGIALNSKKERAQVVHHALLAHGLGCQAIRAASPVKCNVGTAENFMPYVPIVETPEHIEAVRRAFVTAEPNACILMPMLTGRYDETWLAAQGDQGPDILEGDMKTIHQPLDSLGFNCYTAIYVKAANNAAGYEMIPMFDNYPKANTSWLYIVPESIYWGARMVAEVAGQPKLPIFISENGCADGVAANARGEVADTDRIMFLRAYLKSVQRLQAEGYPLIGYFPWSLMDNFEWGDGYATRFGITHVDYQTQKRTPKLSYHWYREVIRSGRII